MADFSQIIGQDSIIEHFQKAITENLVSHAYIINGEDGSGKMLLAKAFAKQLQCQGEGERPCGSCQSCMQLESGNHPDVIYVTYEKTGIGVDDIRSQINNTVDIKPYSSPFKIYIVDEAHKMTEQAQNALLKTIEEPPDYAVILLLTDNVNRLLPTIQSRCVLLQTKPVAAPLIKAYLMEKKGVPDYAAELAAAFSQGNVGKAIRFAASEHFMEMKEEVLVLLKNLYEMSMQDLINGMHRLSERKREIDDCIDFMILWYRDVCMFKVTRDANLLLYKEEIRHITKHASKISYEGIEKCIQAMEKAKARLRANVNFDITIEMLLLTLKENGNG
ncbi:DNA polymerase III subunit delta' [Anaerolentibacter hominis]|uniref:DNA polymerase III subunit delta' n=1 Tax=Anaerolentibacter hominis TaxID=3079009 RepID=UPI0031B80598